MDIIKTGIGIGKTIRNVSRLREIVNVFALNGLDEFVVKTNVHRMIPGFVLPKSRIKKVLLEASENEITDWWQIVGLRLRKSFQTLGPSFIKLGQLLSTREDIFGTGFIEEMKLLQNKVEEVPIDDLLKIIEERFHGQINEIFSEFNSKPIGVASIGVVFKAKLKNGEDVVIKVRKPDMKSIIETDFEIMKFLVSQIEKVSKDIRYLGISRVLDDFEKSIKLELNFNMEALNCRKLEENLKKIDKEDILKLPKIYGKFTSEDILVMEFLKGIPFVDLNKSHLDAVLEEKMIKSVHLFLHTLLADGFFHADLHGGNFFLLDDGKIGIIDFGLVGVLSKKNRDNLVAILFALSSNNYENLVYEFLDVAEYDIIPREQELIRDLKDALRPYMGLSLQETNMTDLVGAIVSTLSKHQIYLPREWFVIFRALMTLDGVGKQIGIDLDILAIIEKDIKSIMSELLSKESIAEDLMWVGRDVINSIRVIPRHIRWYLKESAKNGYKVKLELQDLDKYSSNLNRGIYFIGIIMMAGVLVFCGTYFLFGMEYITVETIPTITWIFWALSLAMFVGANVKFRIK
jgi:ubiquinone biosynthesis protein